MKDTDNELIALAAKAIGLNDYWDGGNGEDKGPLWNPICDDGDALRLAVSLNMRVYCYGGNENISFSGTDNSSSGPVQHGDDKFEATRRAIVLAAAVMGKAMP